jgi:hypothetical protein
MVTIILGQYVQTNKKYLTLNLQRQSYCRIEKHVCNRVLFHQSQQEPITTRLYETFYVLYFAVIKIKSRIKKHFQSSSISKVTTRAS